MNRGSARSERAMVGPRGHGVLGHYRDLTHTDVRVSCICKRVAEMREGQCVVRKGNGWPKGARCSWALL